MATVDIVARLQLRADQFASETGQRFAELKTRAASTASELRSEFSGAFGDVNRMAQKALTLPRTTGGQLDLSAEIAQLRQSAAASEQRAMALREVEQAATRAAGAAGINAQALRLDADAAKVAALAEDQSTSATRDRIVMLEAMQKELGRSTTLTNANTDANRRNGVSAGQQRAAMSQLGMQLNDVATSYASGTPPMQIFAQQSGQVVQALQLMSNGGKGVLAFLAGPWGAVLTAAGVVMLPLVARMIDFKSETEKATDKLREQAAQERMNAAAQEAFNHTLEGRIALQKELNKELDRTVKSEGDFQNDTLQKARDNVAKQITTDRPGLIRQLRAAEATLTAQQDQARRGGDRGDVAARGIAATEARIKGLKQQLLELAKSISAGQTAVREAELPFINRGVAGRIDAATAAADRHTAAIARLQQQYADGAVTRDFYDRERERLDRRYAAAKEAAEKAKQKKAEPSLGSQLATENAARLLSSAESYRGLREDTAAGRSGLQALFGGAGIRIDPEKTAWCAAFVNAVLAGQGIKGTGTLAARDFLGFGTKTTAPAKGDIVVTRRGNGGLQGHVGFYDGTDAKGRILVMGGNTGNAVGTMAVNRRDVLGFRRAPDGAAEFKTGAKDAAAEQRELAQALEAVQRVLDPTRAAAAEYREELERIAKLKAGGVLSEGEADELTFRAIQAQSARAAKAAGDRFRAIFGEDDPLGPVVDRADDYRQQQVDAWYREHDRQKQVQEDSIRDLSDLYQDLFTGNVENIWRNFERLGSQKLGEMAAKETLKLLNKGSDKPVSEQMAALGAGVQAGRLASDIADKIGVRQSKTGATVGAAAGTIGFGPIGGAVGGFLGGTIGGMFMKAALGSAGIAANQYGQLVASGMSGTSGDRTLGATKMADSVASGLQQIADQLGAKIVGATDVKIGTYKDKIRVNTSGGAIGGVKGSGAISFDTKEEAIRFAIGDALKDGILGGISDAAKAILASGQTIEVAIEKALLIESVPKALKARLDPVGAAIDEVNGKFQKIVDALKEGGASAEQMAQAQQLYSLELADAKEKTAGAAAGLKAFLDSLKVGSASPLSLRDQEGAAMATLQPYLDQIGRGEAIDQGKYQAAAQAYLDIERQLKGSTAGYFEEFDRIQAATAKAIERIDNAVPIGGSVTSPFPEKTAIAAEKTATGVQTVAEMTEDTNALLARIAARLDTMSLGGGDDASFIGTLRNFGTAA